MSRANQNRSTDSSSGIKRNVKAYDRIQREHKEHRKLLTRSFIGTPLSLLFYGGGMVFALYVVLRWTEPFGPYSAVIGVVIAGLGLGALELITIRQGSDVEERDTVEESVVE